MPSVYTDLLRECNGVGKVIPGRGTFSGGRIFFNEDSYIPGLMQQEHPGSLF